MLTTAVRPPGMRFRRAEKYGFCAGVRLADQAVKKFADAGNRDGKILGQVVHNERVVAEMDALGVPTVDQIEEATDGTIVFSAHGVPPSYYEAARKSGLKVLDTTCPFVFDIHEEADRAASGGEHLVFIGEPKHREVIGYTNDRSPETYHVLTTLEAAKQVDWAAYERIKILYQSTLNAEDFEEVVRYIESENAGATRADTICYATKENQDAARELAESSDIDLILVIGGKQSANTRHLWELCEPFKATYLVHSPDDLEAAWFDGVETVGITAGASTPDYLIDEIEARAAALAETGAELASDAADDSAISESAS